jgi:polyvinyl alcohol dehydrogenase (cytochrome)
VRRLGAVWSFEASNRGITGTPIVGGGTVVVASALGTLFALDAARGRLRWSHDFGEQIYGSAAIVGQRVYVPVSGARGTPSVVALRLRDGKVLWRTVLETTSGSDLYASPVVAEGTLYIGTSAGLGEHFDPDVHVRNSVVALDARTGAQRWKTYTVPPGYDGGAVVTTAAVDTANHRLFVGTGNAYHEPAADTTDAMLSLDTRTGRILRHFQATRRDIYTHHRVDPGPDLDFGASPNLFAAPDGRLLVGELQKSRVYWTLDSRTMNRVWSRRMSTTAGHPFLDTLSSTAYDGRRIYGQSDDGQVMALNPSGTRRWVTPPSGSANYSPVAVADGVVYSIRSEGSLIARRAGTGAILRRIPLGSPSWGGVAVAGGSVFVATGTDSTVNGYVVAYRPRT